MKTLFDTEAAFQAERRTGIGGSDAGAIYNMGFGCKRKLCYEKLGTTPDFAKLSAPELERGHMVEEIARKMYEKRSGRKVALKPFARHPEHPFMCVHVDGETTSPDKPGPGYAEFKVVNRFVMKKFKKEGVRSEYILQLQHGMAVMDYQWGSFGILCLDPWQFEWFDADRDQAIIDTLIEDEEKLWYTIEQQRNGFIGNGIGTILPLENMKDKRCSVCQWRRTCRGNELAGVIPDSGTEAGELISRPDLVPLLEEISELKEISNDADELCEDARKKLKAEIGESYGVIAPGYRALMPTSYPERWDSKALQVILEQVKALFAKEREEFDYEQLEIRVLELMQIAAAITRAKKPPKAERSLRIYSTGD